MIDSSICCIRGEQKFVVWCCHDASQHDSDFVLIFVHFYYSLFTSCLLITRNNKSTKIKILNCISYIRTRKPVSLQVENKKLDGVFKNLW